MSSSRPAGTLRPVIVWLTALALVVGAALPASAAPAAQTPATLSATPNADTGDALEGAEASASAVPGVQEMVATSTGTAFGGRSFGRTGQYLLEKGTLFGAVDPADARNAPITDLENAPRNEAGLVEYSVQYVLLRPADPTKGNHRLVYEPSNRGSMVSLFFLNTAPPTNDPAGFVSAGNGFLMRQGYSILSIAWDPTAPDSGLQATYPVATNPDGSSIVGPALEEITFDFVGETKVGTNDGSYVLTYPAATTDESQATLTSRLRYDDTPVALPSDRWSYSSDGTGIQLLDEEGDPTPFEQSALYEFVYPAKDPVVAGLAFAAIRDVADFIRSAQTDQAGNANPLVGQAEQIYTFCYSQPCRAMHDFIRLGFNETVHGGRAIDGVEKLVGGASGAFVNFRFAQPGRTTRQHIGRWYPERQFPFANQLTTDTVTGRTGGVLEACTVSDTCPKIFEINSETEYWNKAASLLTTDTNGNDLDLAATPDVRYYLLSSLSHAPEAGDGKCQQTQSPLLPDPAARALLVALDQWIADGEAPPANRVPTRGDGTLVPALPQSGVGFPAIPDVTYNGRTTTGDLFDFGPQFDEGILTTLPPSITESAYPVFVPKTDADGNDSAGIRLPEIAVPVATYSGWNIRAAEYAGDDLCNASGQKIPFAETKADRIAAGDPRLSIEERYRTHGGYVAQVSVAAAKLARDGLLLPEDIARYITEAIRSDIGK